MLSLEIFVLLLCIVVVGLFWYSQYSWRGKLLCVFRRPNRTVEEKKVPLQSKWIKYRGGRYRVDPKRIDLMWYKRGINQFFPMFVPFLEFKWDTDQAMDPTTFTNTWDSPEVRELTQDEESYKAFSKGIQSQTGTKSRFPEWLFPAIIIGILLILGLWIYQQGQHIGAIEQMLKVELPK